MLQRDSTKAMLNLSVSTANLPAPQNKVTAMKHFLSLSPDVIHSNGENLILGGLGSWQPMGHVDFYPNGGRVQTGCSNLFVGAVTDIIWTSPQKNEGRSLCNHRRAYKFFIDSVAPRCLFPAFPCASYEDFLLGKCFHCPNRKAKSIRRSNDTTQEV